MNRHLVPLLLLLALALGSCAGPGAVQRFMERRPERAAPLVKDFLDRHEPVAAGYFATRYRPAVRLIPGAMVTVVDTLRLPGLVVPCPMPTAEDPVPHVRCPGSETVTVHTSRVDTLQVPNLARERELELEMGMKNMEIADQAAQISVLTVEKGRLRRANTRLSAYFALALAVFGGILFLLARRA